MKKLASVLLAAGLCAAVVWRADWTGVQASSIPAQTVQAPAAAPAPQALNDTIKRFCGNCHMIDGEGVKQGPDLTRAGEKRDAKWLREWISDPEAMDDTADMPAFNDRLTPEELTAIANYLAARK